MRTGDIVKNKELMAALREIREKVYNDISWETRKEITKKYEHMTKEEKEVINYFLEPGLNFNFFLSME